MYITKQDAARLLPKVGDVRMEIPTTPDKQGGQLQECVVVEVNPAHLWYRVRFKDTGFIECYKAIKGKPDPVEGGA